MSPKSNMHFRFSDSECSSHFCAAEKELSSTDSFNFRDSGKKSPYIMWETALERLRNAINDNEKEAMN